MYLELDGQGPRYAQLIRALKAAVLGGRIPAGERLPATRALAAELGVSRNTVLVAYDQLLAEGFVESRVGAGTFVATLDTRSQSRMRPTEVRAQSRYSQRARQVCETGVAHRHAGLRYNLQYGAPLVNPAISKAWGRELARTAGRQRLDYPGPRGFRALREAICDYLARRRGLQVASDDVIIVSGAQQAFELTARVLLDEGSTVAMEDPNYFGMRQLMQAHGARVVPVPVDREGLQCDALPQQGVQLVSVTPSHQFPSGAVLSLPRRLELLRYAARHDCWILEDDYDGEFRYDAQPLASLRGLDEADRVIYVGSFSKMLFPSLRLGYMVLPLALREDYVAAKWLADLGCPAAGQDALARFMRSPGFDRHLRSARRTLKARRTALLSGLRRYAGDRVEIADSAAGMHSVVWLRERDEADCEQLIADARRVELGLYPIRPHYMKPPPRPGLLLGYAGLSAADLEAAMRLFGRCLDNPDG